MLGLEGKMPGHKLHKKIGIGVAVSISLIILSLFYEYVDITWQLLILAPFIVITFSILPDLDHPMSRIRNTVYVVMFVLIILSILVFALLGAKFVFFMIIIIGVLGILLVATRHRRMLHTYWFIALMSIPLFFVHWLLGILAFTSGSSHIFIDKLASKIKRALS